MNIVSLSLIGQWPFQKKNERRLLCALTFFFCGTLLIAQIRKVYLERDNTKILIDAIAPFIFEGVCSSKILNNIFNIGKMHQLLKHIEKDWEEIEGEEKKILTKFAKQGHMFNIVYAVWIYGAMVGFLVLPITPKIIDALGWANITDTTRFQAPVDYYVDEHENYLYIEIHIFIAVIALCVIVVATDIMFITLVQHACGMFSAVSYTLESLAEDGDPDLDVYPERIADETFWVVVKCIKKQNSILKFAELLDSNYCWSFLVIVGLNMVIITFTGFQMTTHLDSLDEAIQQGIFTLGNLVHLFFESYISQRLTDHSLCIYEALKKTSFYNTSIRTRKLLNLMLLRSVIPCTMKAGKLYVMSMENFSMERADSFRDHFSKGHGNVVDIFQQPCYRINVVLLNLIGQWSYQKKFERRLFSTVTLVFCCTIFVAQVRKMYIARDNAPIVIEAVAPLMFDGMCCSKFLNNLFNSAKIRQMLKCIETDWKCIEGEERKILTRFANEGHKLNIIYTVWIYSSMVFFLILTVTPRIIVACGWANISAPLRFQIPVDYYVDDEENYVYIQIHLFIAIFFLCTIIIASDIMFITLVQHACGMFSAVSYTLEHLIEDDDLDHNLYPERIADEKFWIVAECIKKQNAIIRFSELLESAYCWTFFVVLGFNMGILVFTGFQAITKLDDIDEAIRQGIFTLGETVHLFVESLLSQRLMDHSLYIYEALHKANWYKTSMRTRKLMNFMLLRSVVPCKLRAGKIYTMSMENFSKVIRTSMSYFTILCSFQ